MREKKQMGLNIGSASIIMLFSVLCLTVLASLSMLSANSQWRLANRSAAAVSAYYAADTQAARIYNSISTGGAGADVNRYEDENGDTYASYEVPIDDNQTLAVIVRLSGADGGPPAILQWKAVDSGNWNPDTALDVWDGN
jgi:hypothetical protein